jgi:dethiobiotin synthetase
VIGYFVTGTDTNVGKTYVTSALARRARVLGRKVFAFKPIETGCAASADGALIGADQELLAAAAGDWQRGELRGVYRFPLAAAPLVAATAAGATLDLATLVVTERAGVASHQPDLVLVEGAGGWRVPITLTADMGTLARQLALPVIIVARAGLGTINHTLLSIEAVERDGAQIAAVVMSQRPTDDADSTASNRFEILRRWRGQVIVLTSDESALDPLL